ncbi:EamA family transporter [Deinococcus ficus]|uniref:EamA family transporter n=1 Tax=Deinococcus ficus TaxID=317577 RepID=A0A221T1J1_9DEIO|nr:DMT family transporter [Deinococcus ficus]ASN82740.1 EamA family transporter [Deinococcus ficus]
MLRASSFPPPAAADRGGIGLALLSAAASGTLGLWGKLALTLQLSTPALLSWRFGLTSVLLFALGFGRLSLRLRAELLVLSALYAASTVLFFLALARISAGTAALLVYVAPAFVILYGALAGVRPTRGQGGALLCTLAGLGVVVGLPGAGDGDSAGLLLGGASGALYGGYLYASGRLARTASPLTVTAHVSLVCAATFVVLGGVTAQLAVPHHPAQWGVILAMLLIPTLVALPALSEAVRRIGPARVSLLTTTDPLWAALFALLFLGEDVHLTQVVGGALILAGAAFAQRSPATTAPESSGQP